jgi:hypothetical protein
MTCYSKVAIDPALEAVTKKQGGINNHSLLSLSIMTCHSKSAIDPALQAVMKTTRWNKQPQCTIEAAVFWMLLLGCCIVGCAVPLDVQQLGFGVYIGLYGGMVYAHGSHAWAHLKSGYVFAYPVVIFCIPKAFHMLFYM